VCIAFNAFTISYQGSRILGLDQVPLLVAIAVSMGAGLTVALLVQFLFRPFILRWINCEPAYFLFIISKNGQ
jgi:hypothetical protein